MWILNNRVILEGRAFVDDNGVKHPASWGGYSSSYKASIGLVEVAVEAKPDETFYYVTGPDLTGAYTSTPRELEDRNEVDENGDPVTDADGNQIVTPGLKSQWIERTKQTQASLLSQTDWAYIRQQDTGAAVPDAIQVYRNAVRLAASAIEDQITQAADLDAFMALFPDAINNWPDPI